MAIWTSEIKELEKLYESLKGQLPELEKELGHLIKTEDENVILLYSRRCLEVIISDLCECELKRPRKTEPLKGIIDKLHKEGKVPPNIISSMHGLNELSTYGTHPKDFDPEQVKPVLNNLDIIIKWYLKYKETGTDIKGKPDEEIKHEIKSTEDIKKSIQIPKNRLIGLVSGLILLIMIVAAVLFFKNIIGSGKQTKELDKSIAVLPFFNDSPSDSNQYFINGIMEEVLNNLQKIKDFRVLSRTSTDQYKGLDRPTIPEIAKKLGVSYIVEGSGQKYGNSYRLRVQLIVGNNERHLWAESYEKEIKEIKDIYDTQSEIAQSIASALKATITPDEKQRIEKTSTTSLTAYDFYQRGNEEFSKYTHDYPTTNKEALGKAGDLFKQALKYDSTFARAYLGLSWVFSYKHYSESYLSENFLDSMLILANKALSLDGQLADAYTTRGIYYQEKGSIGIAMDEYDKALKYNPNDYTAYSYKAYSSFMWLRDFVEGISNMHNAVARNRGSDLPDFLRTLGGYYLDAGFIDKAKNYYHEAFALDRDSTKYILQLALIEYDLENFTGAFKMAKQANGNDTTKLINPWLLTCLPSSYNEEVLKQYKKWIEYSKKTGELLMGDYYRIAIAFWRMGNHKEAKYYFDQDIKYLEGSFKLGRSFVEWGGSNYSLAAIYAFLGDKGKAYKYLEGLNKLRSQPWSWVVFIKNDPCFQSIRNEERFQKILQNMEAKYKAEHERVKKWLEGQGMLEE